MTTVIYKTEDVVNKKENTRTFIIYKNNEWNASYTSNVGEGYMDFMNRINEEVKKQTNNQVESKW